ncbi:MAG: hypothetical protein IH859_02780 [Chloroflexi bacterium]|nr:hypothetical protein [Chloroflexota bacterium]
MIIHQPEIIQKSGQVYLSARIETSRPISNFPKNLWYSFPENYISFLDERADGFAASLLLIAMLFQEDLEVRGEISPKLTAGMAAFQTVYSSWFPQHFKQIAIKCAHQTSPVFKPKRKFAMTFSGGLDSFYTLRKNLSPHQPDPARQLSAAIFVHGFDLRLDDEANRDLTLRQFSAMFSRLGMELYTCSTNIYQFSEFRIGWPLAHTAPLAGAALIFAPLFKSTYIPTADEYLGQRLNGKPPKTDKLLSTESTTTISHGHDSNRREKLAAIMHWPEAQNHLRVCVDKKRIRGVQNCSRCDKCLTLMTDLELSGMLPEFNTFHGTLSLSKFIFWGLTKPIYYPNQKALRKKALLAGRKAILYKLRLLLALGWIRKLVVSRLHALLPGWLEYRLKRTLYKPEFDPRP